MVLPVTEIQRFSTHDGPGVRTTVFLKGCPLRCKWCHNTETQSTRQQIYYTAQKCIGCGACIEVCPAMAYYWDQAGVHQYDVTQCTGCMACPDICPANAIEAASRFMTVDEIFTEVLKDEVFYGKQGGLTLSGGEPLIHPEGCLKLLQMAKNSGLSTAVETAGCFDESYIPRLAHVTDLFLWDFKDGNAKRHIEYTTVSNDKILHNLFLMDKQEVKILLRCIMIKTVNMHEDHYRAIADTFLKLNHCIGVELIPYHAYGGSKNEQLGYADNGRGDWIPLKDDLQAAKLKLRQLSVEIL